MSSGAPIWSVAGNSIVKDKDSHET
jgi:hypothetical protein